MVYALPGGRMGCLDQVHHLLFIKFLYDLLTTVLWYQVFIWITSQHQKDLGKF